MATSPFIDVLTSPQRSAAARPLESALPRRQTSSPSLLAQLSKRDGTRRAEVAAADEHQDAHESALAARLCAALAELEHKHANRPEPIGIAEMALTAARAVLNHELKTQRDVLRRHIEAACQTLEGEQSLRVRLHPDLADTYLKGPRPDPFGLEVLSDATLEPGTIVVEGDHTAADASVETRLAQFQEALELELERDDDAGLSPKDNVA